MQGTPDPLVFKQALADDLKRRGCIRTPGVGAAFRAVPRHLFVPGAPLDDVYGDKAIPTKRAADGRFISSSSLPATMALMLELLGLAPGHRVLEIGAGTGYNAALMAHIVGKPAKSPRWTLTRISSWRPASISRRRASSECAWSAETGGWVIPRPRRTTGSF